MEKCVCHINGYRVKDSIARKEIEEVKKTVEDISVNGVNIKDEDKKTIVDMVVEELPKYNGENEVIE